MDEILCVVERDDHAIAAYVQLTTMPPTNFGERGLIGTSRHRSLARHDNAPHSYPVEDKPLTLRFDGPEAVVLFALLQRFQATGKLELEHEAERRLLLSMFDALEGDARAPLEPHYDQVLDSARERVAKKPRNQ